MKKSKIDQLLKEFIDSEMNLIGNDTMPKSSPDLASKTGSKPTDYHARMAHQPHTDDYIGRIGSMAFNESEEVEEPKLDLIAKEIYNWDSQKDPSIAFEDITPEIKANYTDIASKIMGILQPKEDTLSEAEIKKMMEDKLTSKKDSSFTAKKETDVLPDNVKKITDLISNLAKKDRDILMKKMNKK